jgi:uncharacterized LabA/DUF88 family protein
MAEYIYVDNSNLYISAKFESARTRGIASEIRYDESYHLNFFHLYQFLTGNDRAAVKRCALFGSDVCNAEALWQVARKAGFETHIPHREFDHGEKMVDTALVTAMIKDAYTRIDKSQDTVTLVSGDADFVPPVRTLRDDGYTVEVCFWDNGDWELKKVASKFISLNPYIEFLALKPNAES